MGGVIKGIGKVVSAPVRGIGHALKTSHIPGLSNIGGAAENVGNAFAGKGAFLRDIGKAGESAAPIAGLIPGVGPLAGGLLGAGGALLNRGFTPGALGEGLKYGGEGALSGAVGQTLFGGKGIGGITSPNFSGLAGDLGNIAGKVGKAVASPNLLGNAAGNLDLGKVAGLGMAGANLAGAQQQRKSAQNYTNAQIDLKNKLLSSILAPQNYNLPGTATRQTNMTTGLGSS